MSPGRGDGSAPRMEMDREEALASLRCGCRFLNGGEGGSGGDALSGAFFRRFAVFAVLPITKSFLHSSLHNFSDIQNSIDDCIFSFVRHCSTTDQRRS